ncbi:MAG: hypothetical protein HQK49_06275 [Oligoflexia bacterium]|nr:hypothetical protein [Oligoflexia bacterium]
MNFRILLIFIFLLIIVKVVVNANIANNIAFSFDQVEIKGFLTTGATRGDSNNPLNYEIDKKVNYLYDTKLGLNFSSIITNHWTIAAQLLAKKWTGENEEDFKVKADWIFAKYRPYNSLYFKVGKQKLPLWLISEYLDVGLLYPWIRPPLEVYTLGPLSNFFGGSINYTYDFGTYSVISEVFIGQTSFNLKDRNLEYSKGKTESIFGSNITFFHPQVKIRASVVRAPRSYQDNYFQTNTNTYDNGDTTRPVRNSYSQTFITTKTLNDFTFWTLGTQLNYYDSFLYSEYAHLDEHAKDFFDGKYDSFYFTLGHRIKKVTPVLTYAFYKANLSNLIYIVDSNPPQTVISSTARISKQHSLIAGLIIHTTDNSDLKFEYQRSEVLKTNGTYEHGLFSETPGPQRPVSIFSIAFDYVF